LIIRDFNPSREELHFSPKLRLSVGCTQIVIHWVPVCLCVRVCIYTHYASITNDSFVYLFLAFEITYKAEEEINYARRVKAEGE